MVKLSWLHPPVACSALPGPGPATAHINLPISASMVVAATAAEKMIADRRQRAKLKAKESNKEKAGRAAIAPASSESMHCLQHSDRKQSSRVATAVI